MSSHDNTNPTKAAECANPRVQGKAKLQAYSSAPETQSLEATLLAKALDLLDLLKVNECTTLAFDNSKPITSSTVVRASGETEPRDVLPPRT